MSTTATTAPSTELYVEGDAAIAQAAAEAGHATLTPAAQRAEVEGMLGFAPIAFPDVEPGAEIPLFTIHGEVFTMPHKVGANIGLQYQWEKASQSVEYADAYLMRRVLGPKTHEALMAYADLNAELLQQVFDLVSKVVQDAQEITPKSVERARQNRVTGKRKGVKGGTKRRALAAAPTAVRDSADEVD